MSLFKVAEIALDVGIYQNTAATAQAAMMPEHVKEAAWLSNGFYTAIRRKSLISRRAFNTVIFAGLFLSINDYNTTYVEATKSRDIIFTIGLFVLWLIVSAIAKRRARAKANARAWAIVNEKEMKESVIRDALYARAHDTLRIAR
jgi:hypothetical protein